ncbi:hypothetical protein G6F37_007141 [Rhizopus arrhizus]|nr:hypothetical protein G6F38_011557 [Rhizopus arrhizus]KAG1156958.1 hypothetical protein G6F37_007141 [Rhizopus arrhizus]
MSNFNRVVFEDGKGGLRDEEAVDLMKVDKLDVQVRKLVTMEYYLNQQLDIEVEMLESEEKPVMNTDLKKKKKKYTIYSEYDKMNFILHMLTKAPKKIAPVARKYSINERTGQRWWNRYKNDPDTFFLPKSRGDRKKLHEEYQAFLTDLLDGNPSINIEQALEQLTTKFDDLQVGKSAVHEFIRDDMGFTFKRNDEGAIEVRYEWAKKIVESDMSFLKICVFIDESGFHINMNRSGAWARKGEIPVVKFENTRAVSHTILGGISAYAVVNISIRTPSVSTTQLVSVEVGKKRKLGNGKTQKPKPKGTTTDHYLRFLSDTLDILDDYKYMQSSYIFMDNALIHKRANIQEMIANRGYKCVYLPPYSPELNPIEQFWSAVKSKLKRHQILEEETLQDRITEACSQIPQVHLYGFVKYSHSRLEDCLNKKAI